MQTASICKHKQQLAFFELLWFCKPADICSITKGQHLILNLQFHIEAALYYSGYGFVFQSIVIGIRITIIKREFVIREISGHTLNSFSKNLFT